MKSYQDGIIGPTVFMDELLAMMQLDAPILYHFLKSVDSTNTWVRSNYTTFDLSRLHVVHAAEQTQGKGTHGKSWVSPKDFNIYATLFLSLPHNRSYATLAQLLSISIAQVLTSKGFSPTIKWPNDLMLEHKKIGGILCELVPIDSQWLVILGFGLNVNMPEELCKTIDQPTTSLFASSRHVFSLSPLLYLIGTQFQHDLLLYLSQDFSCFVPQYRQFMIYTGYPVVVNDTVIGISQNVNNQGELEVLSPEGKLLSLTSGSIKI